MGEYFDALADIVSPAILAEVNKRLIGHIHRGAETEEPVLLRSMRDLIELVRAEERAIAEAAAEERHRSLRAHYVDLEERLKASYEDARRNDVVKFEHALRAYNKVHQMALTARAARRKTLPAAPIIAAVGLEQWEKR